MFPKLDTQEKVDRAEELAKLQGEAHIRLAQVAQQCEQTIFRALRAAEKSGLIYADEECSIADDFKEAVDALAIAQQRFGFFISTGTEDTMYADKH